MILLMGVGFLATGLLWRPRISDSTKPSVPGSLLVGAPDGLGKIYVGNFLGNGHLRRVNDDGTGLESVGDPGPPGGSFYHVMVVPSETSVGVRLANLRTFSDSAFFSFDLSGVAGAAVSVQRSSNLMDWSEWQNLNMPSSGMTNIVDVLTNSSARRFYRAKQQ